MSKWLKSVNNLLDNIDGQAGTLQGNAVERGRDVLNGVLQATGYDNDDEYDSYTDNDEEEGDAEDIEDDEDDEEEQEDEEDEWVEQEDTEEAEEADGAPLSKEETAKEHVSAEESEESYDDIGEDSDVQREKQDRHIRLESSDDSPATVKVEAPSTQEIPELPSTTSEQEEQPSITEFQKETKVLEAAPSTEEKQWEVPSPDTADEQPTRKSNAVKVPAPPKVEPPLSSSSAVMVEKVSPTLSTQGPPPPARTIAVPTPPPSSGVSTVNKTALKKAKAEAKKWQQECRGLQRQVDEMEEELERAQKEVQAQQTELENAAKQMQQERQRMKDDREDLLDEQEDEMEEQKQHYENLLEEQAAQFEDERQERKEQLAQLEHLRNQEGSNYTTELEDSLERERSALKQLYESREQGKKLQGQVEALETTLATMQKDLDTTSQQLQTATTQEKKAEETLEETLANHKRQLAQSKSRETELEQTIADLSAALARESAAKTSAPAPPERSSTKEFNAKEQLSVVSEELQTTQAQLDMEKQRSQALQQQLQEVSAEHTKEAEQAQGRQRQYDARVAELQAQVTRLQHQSSSRVVNQERRQLAQPPTSSPDTSLLIQENSQSKKQIQSLSEQLLRQQNQTQQAKTEILALKGRLDRERIRADTAEQLQQQVAATAPTLRRRVKGGRTGVRSMRSALNMPNQGQDGCLEQTLDGVDSFMIETGSYMKQEPLARLVLLFYLCVLHLWSFCLVIFHAHSYEEVHGDLGNLSESGGGLAPADATGALRGSAAHQP